MQACCAKGFRWGGTPTGREARIANSDTYITGANADRAILILHDGAGWKSPNNRLLADHFAEEVGATVYVPDFFKDDPFPYHLATPGPDGEFDLAQFLQENPAAIGAWAQANGKPVRRDEVFAVATALRAQYPRLGVSGYCWGGWGALQLGAKDSPLVDAVNIAHPSMLEHAEIDAVGVPVQVQAAERDPVYNEALRAYTLEALPKRGVPFSYQFFPGQEHGFATRGNERKGDERKAMALAKETAVTWFRNFLVDN